ncbi:hypothetical protein IAG41_00010 [Sphingomonas sp. JC676]|uniref:hypothetical protein n=1 Tax=Sphingomonas sp. JC676 TaxID=2768065 RepID=UPI001657C391|nr:hypothetical protein [Sphingomonas sp. JC676]MBC9030764.1 hypothetical protein [Sphingomonas sp. JC676]
MIQRSAGRIGSGTRWVLLSLLFGACALFATDRVSSGAPQDNPCPAQLSGAISRPPAYEFRYMSRTWRVGNQNRVGNCVRNSGRRGLFIDWRKANLSGFVAPGKTVFSILPSEQSASVAELSPFFYGARPTRIDVETMVPAARPVRSSMVPAMLWDISRGFLPVAATADMSPSAEQRSAIQIFVPMNAAALTLAAKTMDRRTLIKEIEDHPERLTELVMAFTSTQSISGNGQVNLTYDCVYRTANQEGMEGDPPFRMRIVDPGFHRLMFGTSDTVGVGNWEITNPEFEAKIEIPVGRAIRLVATRIDIFLGDGTTRIGSIPINYLQPE